MNPPEDTHFTRRKGKSSGVSLVWKKQLDYANPLASTSQQLEPVQEQSSDQERSAVTLSEPLDEFYPDLEPEDNLAWDHSGDLHSPPFGSTTSEAGDQSNLQEEGNSTRWSTAVNRVNTKLQADITPERLPSRSRLLGLSESGIGEEVQEEVILSDIEQLDSRQPDSVLVMDEEEYKRRSFQFKKQFRDVEDNIADFTADDVFVQNIDSCEETLNEIKNKFITLRSSLREFYDQFDPTVHPEWEQSWEEKLNELASKYKKNDREVRAKIEKIKREEAQAAAVHTNGREVLNLSGASSNSDVAIIAKAEIERTDLVNCLNELNTTVDSVGDCTVLEDFNVVKYLKQSVTWKSDLKIIDKRYVLTSESCCYVSL